MLQRPPVRMQVGIAVIIFLAIAVGIWLANDREGVFALIAVVVTGIPPMVLTVWFLNRLLGSQ